MFPLEGQIAARRKRGSKPEGDVDVVTPEYRERFTEIVALTDEFCDRFLTDEYKQVCRKMTVGLCQSGSPVMRGNSASWAGGVMYAVGQVNFLTETRRRRRT